MINSQRKKFWNRWWAKLAISMVCIVALFYIMLSMVRLEKIADRPLTGIVFPNEIKMDIQNHCKGLRDGKDIITECNDIICDYLHFNYKNDISKGMAHCIGYSQLTSEVYNYAFKMNGLPYKAKPVYGRANIMGWDVHPLAMSLVPKSWKSFFKDHDYVEVNLNERIVFTDTSFQDITGMAYFH